MHIGKSNEICPDIYIDSWKVKCEQNLTASQYELKDEIGEKHQLDATSDQKYLGDILSANGMNKKTFKKEEKKGTESSLLSRASWKMDSLAASIFRLPKC